MKRILFTLAIFFIGCVSTSQAELSPKQTIVTITNQSSKPVYELRFKVKLTDKQGKSAVGSEVIFNLGNAPIKVDLLNAIKHKTTPIISMINHAELAKVEIVKIRIRGEGKTNKDERGRKYLFEKAMGTAVEFGSEAIKARAKKISTADNFVIIDGKETVFAIEPIDSN